MGVASGCHEGKATPKLIEVVCPECGEVVELFEKEGKISAEETCCKCGKLFEIGTPTGGFEKA